MIKKLINAGNLKFVEISGITINGRGVSDAAVKYMPEFAMIVLMILKEADGEYEEYFRMIPEKYNAIVFPLGNKAYAAFFTVSESAGAFDDVMECMAKLYPGSPMDSVYAHEFDSLCSLEEFVKSGVISRTEKSALYKLGGCYQYVTSEALIRLSEYFIKSRPAVMCVLNEHGEKIIGEDAYDKILSYIRGAECAGLGL